MPAQLESFIRFLDVFPVETVYLLVALGTAVENIFPPIPSDTIVLLGGVLADHGVVRADLVFASAWGANILLAMFVYFSDPEDILPDHIPVIGYLDDVIIIELVTREMQHVREAYDDFRSFRRDFDAEHGKDIDGAIRRDRLDRQRQKLHQRMARRSKRGAKFEIW